MTDFRRRYWQVLAAGLCGLLGMTGCSNAARPTVASSDSDSNQAQVTPVSASDEDAIAETHPAEVPSEVTAEEPKKKSGRPRHGRRETPIAKEAADETPLAVKSTGDRKVSWEQLSGLLENFKGCRYRPTREDWDNGDKSLAKKLSSLQEEVKGQEIVARRNLVDQIVNGRDETGVGLVDVMIRAKLLETLFEKLGEKPTRSDRKVSWEKLEAMLFGLPVAITREDWEAGDRALVSKLGKFHEQLHQRELAIMQRNAYVAATTGGEISLASLFAAQSDTSKVAEVLKEIQSPAAAQ